VKFDVSICATVDDIFDFDAGHPAVKVETNDNMLERTTSSKFFNVIEQF
jgi:hypothetical protein